MSAKVKSFLARLFTRRYIEFLRAFKPKWASNSCLYRVNVRQSQP